MTPDNGQGQETIDVLVAGSGIGGLASAVIAASDGAGVVVEEAASVGGTTAKSAGYMWVPNNPYPWESGRSDPSDAALRYRAGLRRRCRWANPGHRSSPQPSQSSSAT
jgi:3-oxosteroid 1-dehydrogenase